MQIGFLEIPPKSSSSTHSREEKPREAWKFVTQCKNRAHIYRETVTCQTPRKYNQTFSKHNGLCSGGEDLALLTRKASLFNCKVSQTASYLRGKLVPQRGPGGCGEEKVAKYMQNRHPCRCVVFFMDVVDPFQVSVLQSGLGRAVWVSKGKGR